MTSSMRCMLLGIALLCAAPARGLDFELPLVDGGGFRRLSELPPAVTLVNFWRADCPPCTAELPLLLASSREMGFRLITVALQTPAETRTFWPRVPGDRTSHIALHGPSNPWGLLRRFGNKGGAIPYSAMLREDGSLCAVHSGEIGLNWIADNLAKCTT